MSTQAIDLKKVLMILGNRLVAERGFDPAVTTDNPHNTNPVKTFTDWLNGCADARAILNDMGFQWSMPVTAATPEGIIDQLARLRILATHVGPEFPSGRRADGAVSVECRRGRRLLFFVDPSVNRWSYEVVDRDGDCQRLIQTWLFAAAPADSVATLIASVLVEVDK